MKEERICETIRNISTRARTTNTYARIFPTTSGQRISVGCSRTSIAGFLSESTTRRTVDATHKVDESKTGTDEKTVYLYSELRIDKNCKMYRLGYTREEVESILEAGK